MRSRRQGSKGRWAFDVTLPGLELKSTPLYQSSLLDSHAVSVLCRSISSWRGGPHEGIEE